MSHLIEQLHEIGAIRFGSFTLKSGITSPIYIDLRLLVSYPELLRTVVADLRALTKEFSFDRLCGVPYTALPIASVYSTTYDVPMLLKRKEAKKHGTKQLIEGAFQPGETCLIIEDLITSGMSIFETIEPLEEAGLKITDIVVILDREQGGKKHVEGKGYRLHSLFTLSKLLSHLEKVGRITPDIARETRTFIQGAQV